MDITVKIENKGIKTGTCGWLKKVIEEGETYFTENTSKEPCIFFKSEGVSHIVCKIPNYISVQNEDAFYDTTDKEVFKVYPTSNTEGNNFFESYILFTQLTPKAEEKAQEFIDECAECLIKKWNEL